jgi:hypothetical protein
MYALSRRTRTSDVDTSDLHALENATNTQAREECWDAVAAAFNAQFSERPAVTGQQCMKYVNYIVRQHNKNGVWTCMLCAVSGCRDGR